ncbi:MAG: MerR family transcriptional regulator [Candidatus Omnitrophota bacterium]|nr:MerR family transcriptional regulator [Candidatus Omnitrophota bacterium]
MKNAAFYTTKDVLDRLMVTRPTLYKWLREGKIPEPIRDRNNFRLFTAEDIENILGYKTLIRKPIHNGNGSRTGKEGGFDGI